MAEAITEQAVIDFAEAAGRIPGGIAAVKQLAPELAQECRQQLASLRAALGVQDADQARLAAHSIKGAAAMFSASRIEQASRALEKMACKADFSNMPAALEALEIELERLEGILIRKI